VLAAEGLVAMKLRRGAYVAEVSPRDLAELFHLLGVLEGDAAAVFAEKASDAQLAELAAIHAELEASTGDPNAFFAANERFHVRLLELADNRWRQQMVADLRKVMKLNRHQSLLREGRIDASLQEHRKVLAALQSRDPARAQAAMREHIVRGRDAAIHRL
jgi:DNA-binding GntR family transcriptional regulator